MKIAVDSVLEDSFPASDPPSWTLGIERPAEEAVAPSSPEDSSPAPARGATAGPQPRPAH